MGSHVRLVEKAERDPFFVSVIQRYGVEYLTSAGFFDDGAEVGVDMANFIDHRLPVTSLHKVEDRLSIRPDTHRKAVLLVTTGGFCPIHPGHLWMMESAKAELESRGFFVAGGFIAPDHDQYVLGKCGKEALHAARRVELVRTATAESDWLEVDPWAALYVDRSVNFTDYIRRMEAYVRHHSTATLEVMYVCGLDNAGFARAFTERNGLVVVPRSGISWRCAEPQSSGRIIFCKDHQANDLSSRKIRSQALAGLTNDAQGSLQSTTSNCHTRHTRPSNTATRHRVSIALRDEQDWAIRHWIEKYGTNVRELQREFVRELMVVFDRCFSDGYPDAWLSIERLPLSLQETVVKDRLRFSDLPTISLDACIESEWNVHVSRLFEITSSKRLPGLISRPGSPELASQIAAIPTGEYALLDDDIATGATIRSLLERFPADVRIKDIVSVHKLIAGNDLHTIESESRDDLREVGDVRDFLLGTSHGGLVVKTFNGGVIRVPYLQPYVRNATRMSLPTQCERAFSLQVWRLNRDFFTALPGPLFVRECSRECRAFASYIGFSDDDSLLDIASWHIRELEKAGG
jgi:nicotinic acid mononucleotide adenylyltransferase